MTGLMVCIAVLAAASAFGMWHQRRNGRLTVHKRDDHGDAPRLGAIEIGAELGERATLLQFSSAFCQPCRATRRTLVEVAGMIDGVAHVEIDAEAHLDLVRELNVLRTPTVLVLDADGRIVRRAAGQPRKADVIAALGTAVRD
ncbi:TlpA family protein disulfide reductase [Streptomyces lydicus]|uniref:TlpA family protein disulfide reductase n=1 Tax=Streptomyces lydicus TaxID=47763 RepID=UPI00287020EA|nr:thioredoxin family protein [Streptomyces lydicus]